MPVLKQECFSKGICVDLLTLRIIFYMNDIFDKFKSMRNPLASFRFQLLGIPVAIFLFACSTPMNIKDNYPKDKSVSNVNGEPLDSTIFYFPSSIRRDTQVVKTEMEGLGLPWFSANLRLMKEPLLYNFYLGHDVYRFLWLRSFNLPLCFSLHKDGGKVWLSIKELDRHPKYMDQVWSKFVPPPRDSTEKYVPPVIDSIVKVDRSANIILNETKDLSLDEWNTFEELIKQCDFWNMESTKMGERGLDGSEWVMEGHLKNKYWFVEKWAPDNNTNYRKCGEYLIKLSALNERIY